MTRHATAPRGGGLGGQPPRSFTPIVHDRLPKNEYVDSLRKNHVPYGVPNDCKYFKEHTVYRIQVSGNVQDITNRDDWELGPCGSATCKCCKMWVTERMKIHAPYNGKKVMCEVRRAATCKTKNVVYALSCPMCDTIYVGETKQTLAGRVGAHRRNIEGRKEDTHLVNHFTKVHGQLVMPHVRILETMYENEEDKVRKEAETKWILALNTTYPWGLNTNVTGYGALTETTDPADRRKCPWFTVKFQRVIPRGYKQKHKKKSRVSRLNDGDTSFRFLEAYKAETQMKTKYRLLTSLKTSELQRLRRLAEAEATSDTYRIYQEIASFALSRIKKEEPVEKKESFYVAHEHVNFASTILRPERVIGRSKLIRSLDPRPCTPRIVVTRRLPSTLGSLVINYSKFLRTLCPERIMQYSAAQCDCATSPYCDQNSGHVVSGDLRVVADDVLRTALSKGSSYRLVQDTSVEHAKINCLLTLMTYVHFVLYRKAIVDARTCAMAYEQGRMHIDELATKAKKIMKSKSRLPDCDKGTVIRPKIRQVHDSYVVVPVDKAANNFAFVCKNYYVDIMNKELGVRYNGNSLRFTGNKVYKPITEDADSIMDKHAYLTKKFTGINLSEENRTIPVLWASVKFHKIPTKYRFIAGARNSSMKQLSVFLTKILHCIKQQWSRYLKTVSERTGIQMNWSISRSQDVVHLLKTRKLPDNNKLTVADFSTLYTAFEHSEISTNLGDLVNRMFKEEGKYISVGRKAYYHSDEKRKCLKLGKIDILELIDTVISNSYVSYGGHIFLQTCGIPMGSNCSPVIADLCLSYMEFKFLSNKANIGPARQLSNSVRYIDDIATFGTHTLKDCYNKIYPDTLPLSFDDTSAGSGHFLDLYIDRNRKLITLYDKRNDFKFEVIRFPFKSSNQPIGLGLNVLYAQVVRVARICGTKDEFLSNLAILCNIVSDRGYSTSEIRLTLRKTYKSFPLLFRRYGFHRKTDLLSIIA